MNTRRRFQKYISYFKKYSSKILIDYLLLLFAFPLSFLIRLDWQVGVNRIFEHMEIFVLVAGVKLLTLCYFRPFTSTWRQISFYDTKNVVFTGVGSTFLWTFFIFLFSQSWIPRSIPILDMILAISLLFTVRVLRRYVYELNTSIAAKGKKNSIERRSIIIGAGQAAGLLLREIQKHPEIAIKPVAILDDDLSKVGQRLANVPIKGPVDEIAKWVDVLNAEEVIIAVANGNHDLHRRAINLTTHLDRPLGFRTIPALVDLISGEVKVDRIREVNVEDLLGRESVSLNEESIKELVFNQVIMVTGAGGSIGSELARQVARYVPRKIVLVGRGENSLYLIEQELREMYPELHLEIALCNIQNINRTEAVFRNYRPNIVLHAAAHKHVPLVELNASEAVFNNIIGTRNMVAAAHKFEVTNFVNISTDKAVNPTSVMGASKHIAEAIVYEASKQSESTCFVSVRFGNVLGSRGSVIPLFKKQIQMGGPVTVTHPEMIRYFMTIPEAAQLVLQAASFLNQGKLYVLNMGEPVSIYQLAKDLIRLSGLEVGKDIEIVFSGVRPGEKLYEELSMTKEKRKQTHHSKIFEIDKVSVKTIDQLIDKLERMARMDNDGAIRDILNEHIEGASLLQKIDF